MTMNAQQIVVPTVRDIIEIDEDLCDGCGLCLSGCAEGALVLENGKVKLISDTYCDGLGNCLGHCPTGALKVIQRTAEEFDEEAVLALIQAQTQTQAQAKSKSGQPSACPSSQFGRPSACPGSAPQVFKKLEAVPSQASKPTSQAQGPALVSWPIQLKLVSPDAAVLDHPVLILASDCSAFAGPTFHEIFLSSDHPLLIACPKLDEAGPYIEKMTKIIKAHPLINEIRVPMMSLPCCGGLGYIVTEAIKRAGRVDQITLRTWIITPQGEITEENIR